MVGHPKVIEIEAGKSFALSIDVSTANSILSVNYKTIEYDIQVGLFKAQVMNKFNRSKTESGDT